jgi:hypothetical protein
LPGWGIFFGKNNRTIIATGGVDFYMKSFYVMRPAHLRGFLLNAGWALTGAALRRAGLYDPLTK